MKLHRYVDHQRLHIVTKDVISLSISVLLLFRHYISHKITFGAPAVAGYYAVLAVLLFLFYSVLFHDFNTFALCNFKKTTCSQSEPFCAENELKCQFAWF